MIDRARKDANIRDAGPGYACPIFLALKEEARDLQSEAYEGSYDYSESSASESEDEPTSTNDAKPKPSQRAKSKVSARC